MAQNHVWRYTLRLFHIFAVVGKNNTINGKTPIHSSAMAMIDLTEKKAKRRRITTMRDLNREVIWSKAKVRNDLTKYALGLFNDNFGLTIKKNQIQLFKENA